MERVGGEKGGKREDEEGGKLWVSTQGETKKHPGICLTTTVSQPSSLSLKPIFLSLTLHERSDNQANLSHLFMFQ